MKTVYCVSWQAEGEGTCVWSDRPHNADAGFILYSRVSRPGDLVVRFNLEVPKDATPDEVSDLADNAMWDKDYVAIETLDRRNES